VVGATPVAVFLREHSSLVGAAFTRSEIETLTPTATRIYEHLSTRGASFGHELMAACNLSADEYRSGIEALVAAGAVTSDGFAGLRAVIGSSTARLEAAGRWSAVKTTEEAGQAAVEMFAWMVLRRYGVVFRRLLAREGMSVPWRDLTRVYRLLEARGEIRGGRFVAGMSGEQFALPDAVEKLREIRRSPASDRLIAISAADPLNLTGIVTPGDRIRTVAGNRIVYRNGVPVAAMEGDMLRSLTEVEPEVAVQAAALAAGRRVPVVTGYVGRLG
jgi:ATP-dependent Lhr-like helicase